MTVGQGSLEPGLGVKKKLPPVGDISITGIVNLSGAFEHFLLQTTRLSTVMELADAIGLGDPGSASSILRHAPSLSFGFLPSGGGTRRSLQN